MKLEEVMAKLRPVVGLSSLIGAPGSVRTEGADADRVTLGGAREALAHASELQNNAQSDYAYWGYQGQVSYWRTVVSLYEAAEITGPDMLPDIEPDFLGGNHVVMDLCHHMETWGKSVLTAAQEFMALTADDLRRMIREAEQDQDELERQRRAYEAQLDALEGGLDRVSNYTNREKD